MSRICLFVLIFVGLITPVAQAQTLSAVARVRDVSILATDVGVDLNLTLSQGVPYRIFTLDNPRRLILDFNEVDWIGMVTDAVDVPDQISAVRVGGFRAGWSRMVLDLTVPLAVKTASIDTTNSAGASVRVNLTPISALEYARLAGVPDFPMYDIIPLRDNAMRPRKRQSGDEPLVVVLDPGHGGIDPGAEKKGLREADLMLTFARELQETLLRTGDFSVVLTREDDTFVPLEARLTIARRAGADLFLSLHADSLVEGRASGATIYTLSDSASDIASQKLAERHDRADLLAGIDLSDQDDVIAKVLMDLARRDTGPRSDHLADALVVGVSEQVNMHKRPRLTAGFSVLKAPDIPSVLIELGFLSSPRDLQNLQDENWRSRAAIGIRNAFQRWAIADAAEALLLRK